MLNYLVFGIAIIIFATVIIISGKAISRGIEAKQNMKHKSEDEKIAISDTEENANISNSQPNLIDQKLTKVLAKDLKKLLSFLQSVKALELVNVFFVLILISFLKFL